MYFLFSPFSFLSEGRGGSERGGDLKRAALVSQPLSPAGLADPEGAGCGG